MNIRFLKHKVVNDTTKQSARVFYSLDNRIDGRKCVTIYEKDYLSKLSKVFDGDCVLNETDTMTDYICKDRVVLFEDHPLYTEARKRANEFKGIFEGEPKLYEPPIAAPAGGDVYSDLLYRLGVKAIVLL